MGWTNVTASEIIAEQPVLLHGVVILAPDEGGTATFYEGQDAASGRKIVTIGGSSNLSWPVAFYPPLLCERGLYVAVGSNVTEVMVHWQPVPGE